LRRGVFFLAIDFSVRTSAVLQPRRLRFFAMPYLQFSKARGYSGRELKRKQAKSDGPTSLGICSYVKIFAVTFLGAIEEHQTFSGHEESVVIGSSST